MAPRTANCQKNELYHEITCILHLPKRSRGSASDSPPYSRFVLDHARIKMKGVWGTDRFPDPLLKLRKQSASASVNNLNMSDTCNNLK